MNIALHAGVAVLVALILRRLAIPGALLAAAVFALHPVHVESVAWITEQKNTLSAVFYLGAMLVYLRFDRTRSRWLYGCALGLFLLAVLSKTVTATLPGALLVIFWWQRGRLSWRKDVLPLLPFFLLGGGRRADHRLVGTGDQQLRGARVPVHAGRAVADRRPGHLVSSVEAVLAHSADVHLPALADRFRGVVAVSVSAGGGGVAGGVLVDPAADAGAVGGAACSSRHAVPRARLLQSVHVPLFAGGQPLPVSGEPGADHAGGGRGRLAVRTLGAAGCGGGPAMRRAWPCWPLWRV